MQLFLRCRLTRSERPYATRSARLALARTGQRRRPNATRDHVLRRQGRNADLPTLEEVLDEVHASMQEMMKSLNNPPAHITRTAIFEPAQIFSRGFV